MNRLEIPGGRECAARADGAYVAPIWGGAIKTSWGLIPRHGQDLRFPRLAPTGHRFAGSGQTDDQAWMYDGAIWTAHGLAYGPRAVIFDRQGILRVISNAPAVGYRYVADDDSLVTAAATYADVARGIYEYTTLGGITIGQGGYGLHGDDPCIAWLQDGTGRLISEGRCRSIGFDRLGDALSLAWSREDRESAEFVWLTVTELQALPVYQRPIKPEPQPEENVLERPIIVSSHFDGLIRDGWHWVWTDANNPQFGTVDLSAEAHEGGLYMRAKLTNAVSFDQTSGTKRLIVAPKPAAVNK